MDKKYFFIFGILIVGIISTLIVFSYKNNKDIKKPNTAINENYNLVLFGPDEVSIYQGDTYQEIGYYATLNNKLVTNEVKVLNQINYNKLGQYLITYSIDDIVKTRIVNVVEKKISGVSNIKLEIVGNTEINLTLGDTYHDAGCQAFDKDNNNISSKIKTVNPVNTNKVGTYYVTYSITIDNETKTAKRLVIVNPKKNNTSNNQGSSNSGSTSGNSNNNTETPSIKVNTLNINTNHSTSYTKNNITININASGDNFSYIKLPNGNKVYSTSATYTATTNGTYYFYAYDTNNNYNVTTTRISTIDKTAPTLTCKATFVNSGTKITVDAKDNSGISYYNYVGRYQSALSSIQINETLDKNNITVTAYDKAGNSKTAKCSVPSASGNMEVHYINVGREDAIFIKNGDKTIFIDGGTYGKKDTIVPYLKKLGVTHIDLLIGSHLHYNHIQAQAAILDNFSVDKIYYPQDLNTCYSDYCDKNDQKYILDAIKKYNKKINIMKVNDTITLGNMNIFCIGPIKFQKKSQNKYRQNYNSSNFILTFGNTKFMFTGDYVQYSEILKKFSKEQLDIDVLKYPHHGNASLSKTFVNAISPKYVVITNSRDELSSRSEKTYLKNVGASFYYSYKDGNIVITSDGSKLSVKTKQ